MMRKITTPVLLSIIVLFLSCNREKLDTKEYSKELKEKKIKRVTQGEISSNAMKLGTLLNDTLNVLFAANKCDLELLPVVKTFKEDFDATVAIYTGKDTLRMSEIEKQVFQSAEYGHMNQITEAALPNLQNLRNGYWLYSRPLKVGECGSKEFTLLFIIMSQSEIIKKIN